MVQADMEQSNSRHLPHLLRLRDEWPSREPDAQDGEKRTAVHHLPSSNLLSAAASSSLTSRTLATCRTR
jgi:hypothetical protein